MCSFGVKYVTLGKWTGGIHYHIVRFSGPLSTLSLLSDAFFFLSQYGLLQLGASRLVEICMPIPMRMLDSWQVWASLLDQSDYNDGQYFSHSYIVC